MINKKYFNILKKSIYLLIIFLIANNLQLNLSNGDYLVVNQVLQCNAQSSYEVEHFFTHCLIVDSNLAFNKNNFMAKDYDRDCLTSKEFKKILNSFYEKNYMLVNANSSFEISNSGKAIKKDILLPNNKKPLIISIDDVNYDHKKMHLGMADKIAVDKNNTLCSIINGEYDYSKEFVSILNNFIKLHPDFSYNGAKAMLCLTGYDGILGYRTQSGNKEEIESAKKVVEKLKQDGYYFACHSYGHYHMKKVSNTTFESEIKNWENEVEPIIGKTNIYVYPYGENEILNANGQISYKHQLLIDNGYKLFCGVGEKHFYSYYPFNTVKENQVLFMDRRPMDGLSLRNHKQTYSDFFDCYNVYDKDRKISI